MQRELLQNPGFPTSPACGVTGIEFPVQRMDAVGESRNEGETHSRCNCFSLIVCQRGPLQRSAPV